MSRSSARIEGKPGKMSRSSAKIEGKPGKMSRSSAKIEGKPPRSVLEIFGKAYKKTTESELQNQTVKPVPNETPTDSCSASGLESRVKQLERQLQTVNQKNEQQGKSYNNLLEENKQMKKLFQQKEMSLKESLADAQRKHQKALEYISELEEEKLVLQNSVKKLRIKLRKISHRQGDDLQTEFDQEQAHRALVLENEQMKKELMQKDEMLQKSLADAELKHQKALEYISQLEEEKSELTNSMNPLQSSVQQLKDDLHNSHLELDKLKIEFDHKQQAHINLQLEFEEIKKNLTRKVKVLKVKLASAKSEHGKALESINQLEEEKSELTKSVKEQNLKVQQLSNDRRQSDEIQNESLADSQLKHQNALDSISQLEGEKLMLQKSVKKLRLKVRELSQSCSQKDDLQTEYDQLQEAHRALLLENEQMKKELMQKDEMLQKSLADAELKHQTALQSISQLEEEKSELKNLMNPLQSSVQQLRDDLHNSHLELDKLQIEFEQKQQAYIDLQFEFEEIKKNLTRKVKVLKVKLASAKSEHEKALESINQLEEEKSELTKSVKEQNLKVQQLSNDGSKSDEIQNDSLDNAQLTNQNSLQSINQLEEEKSELKMSVKKLRLKLRELRHARSQKDELQTEYDQIQEAHRALLVENEQMKKELMQKDEMLKEYDQQQEAHRALLVENEQMKKELMQKVEMLKEYDQQQEAHRALLVENEQMKKELMQKDEMLQESLADAELKHQKALEYISQLEEEKSELKNSMNPLQSSVQQLRDDLHNSHLELDKLQIEFEQKQQAYIDLQLEFEEMKKNLTRKVKVLKVKLASAKSEHGKALESINQLEEEKSELTKSVKEQNLKVQQLSNDGSKSDEIQNDSLDNAQLTNQNSLQSINQLEEEKSELKMSVKKLRLKLRELRHARSQKDELQTEYDQIQEAHRALLVENEQTKKELMQKDEMLKEYDQQQEAHRALLVENEQLKKELMQKDEMLKESLADAELKHQTALQSISQLEEEKSELTKKLGLLVPDAGRHELQNYIVMLTEYEEMKKELMQEETMKMSLAEAELNHQKALEFIRQLEEEKSELVNLVNTQCFTAQELKEDLSLLQFQFDELQITYGHKREVSSDQQMKNEEMKNLRESLSDAQLNHQKAIESISQLEEELRKSVLKLQDKVRELSQACHQSSDILTVFLFGAKVNQQRALESISELEKELMESLEQLLLKVQQLSHTRYLRDMLQSEFDEQQEEQIELLIEYEEMKKELMQKDALKESLAAAELKHQKALESIKQLQEEKSELMKQLQPKKKNQPRTKIPIGAYRLVV